MQIYFAPAQKRKYWYCIILSDSHVCVSPCFVHCTSRLILHAWSWFWIVHTFRSNRKIIRFNIVLTCIWWYQFTPRQRGRMGTQYTPSSLSIWARGSVLCQQNPCGSCNFYAAYDPFGPDDMHVWRGGIGRRTHTLVAGSPAIALALRTTHALFSVAYANASLAPTDIVVDRYLRMNYGFK